MEKKNKNEEIQSRREFFKNAAKAALPILGAAILANVPTVLNAAEANSTSCHGCNNGCMNFCTTTCHGGCTKVCADSCVGGCRTTCSNACARSSKY